MNLCEDMSHMTERNQETLRNVDALPEVAQMSIASAIVEHPDEALPSFSGPVVNCPKAWARSHIAHLAMKSRADYMKAVSWFCASVRPTNALVLLIHAKVNIVRNGKDTDDFWNMLAEKCRLEGNDNGK